jgi:hypothetical protein
MGTIIFSLVRALRAFWVNSFGMPHIRDNPDFEREQPETTPWQDCSSESQIRSPKPDVWKIKAKPL